MPTPSAAKQTARSSAGAKQGARTKSKRVSRGARRWSIVAWTILFLGVLAWWANDRTAWGSLLGALPPVFWIMASLLCLLAVPKFRWPGWGLWSLVTAGLAASVMLPGKVTAAEPTDLVIRVMTWNIDHLRSDVADYVQVIRAVQPDVVCLQETSDPTGGRFEKLRLLTEKLDGYQLAVEGENAILSRVRVTRAETYDVPVDHYRNKVPVIELSTPQGPVTVANLHLAQGVFPAWLKNPKTMISKVEESRNVRAKQIESTLAMLRERSGAKVLAGDFNLQPYGAMQEKLDSVLNDASADALWTGTFPTPTPLYRIDRIWASSDLPAVRRGVVNTNLSSHRPVWVDLKVR